VNEEIILKFTNEYEFDSAIDEIILIANDVYDRKITIEEVKQMLLQFQEE